MSSPSDRFEAPAEKEMAQAVANGDRAHARRMLESGVSPLAQDSEGLDFLALAILFDQASLFDLLLERVKATGGFGGAGSAALYHAAVAEDSQWLRKLLDAGAAPDAMAGGERLLIVAARSEIAGRMALLLERGADPDATSNSGLSALQALLAAGLYSQAETLLDHGASIWTVGPRGQTPAFWLRRAELNAALRSEGAATEARGRLTRRLIDAGMPYPPPAPQEVLALERKGKWGPDAR